MEKCNIYKSKNNFIIISDILDKESTTKELIKYINNKYYIIGLSRTSAGNSHDASWEEEIQIFGQGKIQNYLNTIYKNKKPSLYESKPYILKKDILTDSNIDDWSKTFDLSYNGEDFSERTIWFWYNNPDTICYVGNMDYLYTTNKKRIDIIGIILSQKVIDYKKYT